MKQTCSFCSPIGRLVLTAEGNYLISCKRSDESIEEETSPILEEAKRWLTMYFNSENPSFKVRIKLENLTDFEKDVLLETRKIPYGSVTFYSAIAQKVARKEGKEKTSSQAVGNALDKNPLLLFIPCHRVVRKDGSLGGFALGEETKEKLLALESQNQPSSDRRS